MESYDTVLLEVQEIFRLKQTQGFYLFWDEMSNVGDPIMQLAHGASAGDRLFAWIPCKVENFIWISNLAYKL